MFVVKAYWTNRNANCNSINFPTFMAPDQTCKYWKFPSFIHK